MNPKHLTKALLFALITFLIKSRQDIWDYLKPFPVWWKLVLAFGAASFLTLSFIYATNLEWLLYEWIGFNPI